MKDNKWLLRKKSGSRNHYKWHYGDFERADHKAEFQHEDVEEKFANSESMITKNKRAIDTTLVKKWLYSQVGKNFDDVYAEFLTRVQPKYMDAYKECIYWDVEKANEIIIQDNKVYLFYGAGYINNYYNFIHTEKGLYRELTGGFYIHPDTNILCRVVEAKKRTMSRKEGKKKHAELITQRNKSNVEWKEKTEEKAEKALDVMKERKHQPQVKVGDSVSFYIDTDLTNGVVESIDRKKNLMSVKTWMGLVSNIPVKEIV